jgi:CRP-like cAMP-binding protein
LAIDKREVEFGGTVSRNRLIAALPPNVAQRLLAQHQRRVLPRRTVLCEVGDSFEYAYFPLNGMVSLLSMTDEGETVETMAIGSEGMIGLPVLLPSSDAPYSVHVQLPTEVIQIKASVLRTEVKTSPILHEIFVCYLHALLHGMSQAAVCHRFHTARQRLCRWLLAARDRADSNVLELTQEVIAQSLGIPRTGVTAVAVGLQDAGAIRCRHGRITILNRAPLEAAACECYRILREETQSLPADSRSFR